MSGTTSSWPVWLVVCAMLVGLPQSMRAQGWRTLMTTGFEPTRYLSVTSAEKNAVLTVSCIAGKLGLGLGVRADVGTFTGLGVVVPLRVRFLPDRAIYTTYWRSAAGVGKGNMATANWLNGMDDLRAKFFAAPAFEVEQRLYGPGSAAVATFQIPNRDVLSRFALDCGAAKQ